MTGSYRLPRAIALASCSVLVLLITTSAGEAQEYILNRRPTAEEYELFRRNSSLASVAQENLRVGGHSSIRIFRIERKDLCSAEYCLTIAISKCDGESCAQTSVFAGPRVTFFHFGGPPPATEMFVLSATAKDQCGVLVVGGANYLAAAGCITAPLRERQKQK